MSRIDDFDRLLMETGISRAQLGRVLGVSQASIYRWGRRSYKVPPPAMAFLGLYSTMQAEDEVIDAAIEQLDLGEKKACLELLRSLEERRAALWRRLSCTNGPETMAAPQGEPSP